MSYLFPQKIFKTFRILGCGKWHVGRSIQQHSEIRTIGPIIVHGVVNHCGPNWQTYLLTWVWVKYSLLVSRLLWADRAVCKHSANKSTVCHCFRNSVCHPNLPYLVSPKPWEAVILKRAWFKYPPPSVKTIQTVRSACLYGWKMAETSLFDYINQFSLDNLRGQNSAK